MEKRIVVWGAVIGAIVALALTAFVKANAADNPATIHEAGKTVAAVNLERVDEDTAASVPPLSTEVNYEKGYTGPVTGHQIYSAGLTEEEILSDGGVADIVMDQADPSRGVLLYNHGAVANSTDYRQLYRTADGGMTWFRVGSNWLPLEKYGDTLLMYQNTIIITGFSSYVFDGFIEISTDYGVTFYCYRTNDLLPCHYFANFPKSECFFPEVLALEDGSHFILAFKDMVYNDGWEIAEENHFIGRYQVDPDGTIYLLEDLTETEGT